jgi:hypothetical protein
LPSICSSVACSTGCWLAMRSVTADPSCISWVGRLCMVISAPDAVTSVAVPFRVSSVTWPLSTLPGPVAAFSASWDERPGAPGWRTARTCTTASGTSAAGLADVTLDGSGSGAPVRLIA